MNDLTPEQKKAIITTFASCLPMLRARIQYTQEDLAQKLGSTRQTIIAVESGKRDLTWSMFLSAVFVFYMNPLTRPLLLNGAVFDENARRAIFGAASLPGGNKS